MIERSAEPPDLSVRSLAAALSVICRQGLAMSNRARFRHAILTVEPAQTYGWDWGKNFDIIRSPAPSTVHVRMQMTSACKVPVLSEACGWVDNTKESGTRRLGGPERGRRERKPQRAASCKMRRIFGPFVTISLSLCELEHRFLPVPSLFRDSRRLRSTLLQQGSQGLGNT